MTISSRLAINKTMTKDKWIVSTSSLAHVDVCGIPVIVVNENPVAIAINGAIVSLVAGSYSSGLLSLFHILQGISNKVLGTLYGPE